MVREMAEHLTALATRGMIRPVDAADLEYLFQHSLVQDAAYESLPPPARRPLHRAIAAALEARYPARRDALAPVLARHYAAAGDAARARGYLARAGAGALAGYANPEAERYFRAALALCTSPADRAPALAGLGEALLGQSRYTEAVATCTEAIDLYQQAGGDSDSLARLYVHAAQAAWFDGDSPGELAFCQAGLAVLPPGFQAPGMAALLHEMARALFFNARLAEARAPGLAALEMARRLGVVSVEAEALTTLGSLTDQPTESGIQTLSQAAALADRAGLWSTALRAHNNLGERLFSIGKFRPARDHYRLAAERARWIGSDFRELFTLANVVKVALLLGELADAEAVLATLRQLLVRAPNPPAIALVQINDGMRLYYQGATAEAKAVLEECLVTARRTGNLQSVGESAYWLGEILLAEGEWEAATEHLLEAITISDQGLAMGQVRPRCLLAAVCLGQGLLSEARVLLDEAGDAEESPGLLNREYLALTTARRATARGRWAEADDSFAATLALQIRLGERWYEARTRWEWGEACLARGTPDDQERAVALLRAAAALFRELGAPVYADRAMARLPAG